MFLKYFSHHIHFSNTSVEHTAQQRSSLFRMGVIYGLLIRRRALVTRELKQNVLDITLDYTNWEKDGRNKTGFMGHLVLLEQ
jgi:hypothetical protein